MRRLRQFFSSLHSRPKSWEGQTMDMLLNGYRASALLYVAAKLKIPDHLAHEAKTSRQLAQTLNVHEPSLHRTLRGLAVTVFCEEMGDDRFKLTPIGKRFETPPGRWEYNL